MAESTKVWVKTSTLDTLLHKSSPSSKSQYRGSSMANDYDDDDKVNWGWVPATILSDGHTTSNDGQLDGSSSIQVMINDEESEFHRTEIEIPGAEIEEGNVVMANFHAQDEEDDYEETANDFDNDEESGYPDDLITLTHLHEPAVLHCLRKRFERDKIYTSTGPILIALNPFKSCKKLYSDTVMRQYWKSGEMSTMMGGSVGSSGSGGVSKSNGGDDDSDVKQQGGEEKSLPPHVYALADATYRSMMLKLDVEGSSSSGGGGRGGRSNPSASVSCDQSILVSGESGAGKTVTTKFIMQYLATLSQRCAEAKDAKNNSNGSTGAASKRSNLKKDGSLNNVNIEQQVLQSNPVLESFGNARTVRNDNSSRFGKFIEIKFNSAGTLIGASIETYLLEKVRLISQSEGERNYHVFYEMLMGMNEEELDQFLLSDYTAEDFRMTNSSGTYDRRDGVQDVDTYVELRDALEVMGFTPEQQNDLFSIAAATLHLSNLTINPTKGGEECEIDSDNSHLEPVLQLLGVTKENLNQAICYFKIEARGQSYTRAVQKDKAEKGVEALIKATYSALFDYIVKSINSSITVKKTATSKPGAVGRGSSSSDRGNAVIGVLDIFGFESFKINSFEQLCINYCNEALQQQFNLFVLQNEQDEYEREGIKWSFISFPDNQDALDLIWKKGFGILNILDDQCRAPGTTDKTFANDIYQKLTGKPRFEANFRQVGARQFGVFHYAGLVEYDTDGFVEKNKDELPREATDLLLSSSSEFVKQLAGIISSSAAPEPPKGARAGPKKSVTVGGHFSKQLAELRGKIDLTSPHYVRCLKPNGALVPDHFDPLMIVQQLRCAGVVEAVRVSRVGYPQRYNHAQFVTRYRNLGLREMAKAAKLSRKVKPVVTLVDVIAKKMVEMDSPSPSHTDKKSKTEVKVDLLEVGIQVGKTKVFLRRRAFDILEKMRKDYMATAAVKVQAIARGYIQLRLYREESAASLQLQCWVRIIIAKRKVQTVREMINARRIQSAYRRHAGRRDYLLVLAVSRWCQRRHRGAIGRVRFNELNGVRKAIVIQSNWRSVPHRRRYQKMRTSVVVVQCAVRCRQARLLLKEFKLNSKNLQNVAQERDKLKQQMEEMKMEVERAKKAAKKAAEEAAKIKAEASASSSSELVTLQEEVQRLKGELIETRSQLEEEQQSAKQAATEAEMNEQELVKSKESVLLLQSKLEKAITDASATNSAEASQMQSKLDEALAELREKDNEIERLREAEADAIAANSAEVSKMQSELDEALAESREKDTEIERLTSEQSKPLDVTNDSKEINTLRSQLNAALAKSSEKDELIDRMKMEQLKLLRAPVPQSSTPATSISSAEHDEIQQQLIELRDELDSANRKLADAQKNVQPAYNGASNASESSIPTSQYEELQSEITMLREELEKSKAISVGGQLDSSGHTKTDKDLKKEHSKMKKEIAKLKEANRKILETAEHQLESLSTFEAENAELREELRNSGIMGIAASATSDSQEIAQWKKILLVQTQRAEEATARQAELESELSKLRAKNHLNGDMSMLNHSIDEDKSFNEVTTLQLEIERLSNELSEAKQILSNDYDDDKNCLLNKNQQLKELADSSLQKDLELQKLKARIKIQAAELDSLREDDLTFGNRESNDDEEESVQHQMRAAENEGLRSLNEELSKQLDLYKIEAEEAKNNLKNESERSEMEMKAFSVALKGVDDLRCAAEQMSRELHFIKRNGYVPPGGLTGEDTSENVKKAMAAIETMAIASQSVDNPTSGERPQLRRGFSLWNAMNAVMTPSGRLRDDAEVCDDSVVVEKPARARRPTDVPSRDKSRRKKEKEALSSGKRRRKKRGDDGSVISSFF